MKTITSIAIILTGLILGCSQKAEQAAPPQPVASMQTESPPSPVATTPPQPSPAPAPASPAGAEQKIMMYKMTQAEMADQRIQAKLADKRIQAGGGSPSDAAAAEQAASPADAPAYRYAARVQATRTIKKSLDPAIESAGQLLVWIGQPDFMPPAQQNMNTQSGVLPQTGTRAISAKITPEFPDNPLAFEAVPKESECQKVEPQGTEVSFKLIPKKLGEFRVGASVRLYGEKGCQGDIITRTAEPITVKVIVGLPPDTIYQEIWDAFMKFFNGILVTLTALLLFLFRRKIKEWFKSDKTP